MMSTKLKISRHTYDIGIIVDLIPVSDGPHASMQSGQCEYVLGLARATSYGQAM